ncbi:MAG: phosphoenolpyruvate--protein phosphotransferase [Elusimicrobia bacterium]|nr:phosphoenolpyruvate--protein phosphotransferase [Elusimicrobiota bacterium]
MKVLKGTVLTEGVALGGACLYREDILAAAPKRDISKDETAAERKRLQAAIEATKRDLAETFAKAARALSPTEASIFKVHSMILEDPSFIEPMERGISEGLVNAESSIVSSLADYEKQFRKLPNEYFKERIQDLHDIASRMMRHLGLTHAGFRCRCQRRDPAVLVADLLTASVFSGLSDKPLAGIIAEAGSKISHGAILAKTLGVPAMTEVRGILGQVGCGTRILIDASKGEVILDPDPETLASRAPGRRLAAGTAKARDRSSIATKDGTRIRLSANAGTIADVAHARERGIKDIGLLRTEAFFLGRAQEPSFDEQVDAYRKVMAATDGAVTFRLLDIGGDKLISYLQFPKEENPNLGLKGMRVYEEYPELIATQFRALLTAGLGRPLRIMVPMVSTLDEFHRAKARIAAALKRLDRVPSCLSVGCMVEVPSAVYVVGDLAEEADFLSVGTNDLIQYVMGADRMNAKLAEFHDPLQPAVLKVLRDISAGAAPAGKELSVCGEIASDPSVARVLVGLGYRHLSVNPHQADKLEAALAESTVGEIEDLARGLLRSKTLSAARKLLAEPARA